MTVKARKAFSSAISTERDWRGAARSVCLEVQKDLGAGPCDLALFFVSEAFGNFDAGALAAFLSETLGCGVLLGCNSSGVIGGGREIEMQPALSLLAMRLPEVKITPFTISPEDLGKTEDATQLIAALDIYPTDKPNFICLADSMSCDIEKLLKLFNEGYGACPVIGGLASGAAVGASNWLCLKGEMVPSGAVGVALSGAVEFEVIVSQGCRPIGEPGIITKADKNLVFELAGRPVLEVLRETLSRLSEEDRELAHQSLFVGLVIDEYQSQFKRGDFLIRNLMGVDAQTGAMAIGSMVKKGQTLQFQLRDAKTSDEDLRALLDKLPDAAQSVQGAFLVSCCGRGRGLYGKPDHDVKTILSKRGPLPIAGFFANGEIGPIGGKNYVHGYTSSLVLIK